MNNHSDKNEEHKELFNTIVSREILEDEVLAALTSEILQRVNVTLERLPQASRALLAEVSQMQTDARVLQLEPMSICSYISRELSEKLEYEYQILKIKQKNVELQAKIDRNNRFLAKLRKDLEDSKQSLFIRNPNPKSTQEFVRELKQKLTAYENSYESVMNKYSSLNVPEALLPRSIQAQLASLQSRHREAIAYKAQADDVIFMRDAKAKLILLRK